MYTKLTYKTILNNARVLNLLNLHLDFQAYLSTKLWKYLSTKLWKSYPSQSKDTGKYKTEILVGLLNKDRKFANMYIHIYDFIPKQMQRLRDQLSNHGETTDRKLAQLKTQLEQGEGE